MEHFVELNKRVLVKIESHALVHLSTLTNALFVVHSTPYINTTPWDVPIKTPVQNYMTLEVSKQLLGS